MDHSRDFLFFTSHLFIRILCKIQPIKSWNWLVMQLFREVAISIYSGNMALLKVISELLFIENINWFIPKWEAKTIENTENLKLSRRRLKSVRTDITGVCSYWWWYREEEQDGRLTYSLFCVLFILVCRMFVTEYTEKQSASNTWELRRLLLIIVEYIVWSARERRKRKKCEKEEKSAEQRRKKHTKFTHSPHSQSRFGGSNKSFLWILLYTHFSFSF